MNDKAQNVNYTVQNPASSTVDLTLNQHKEVTFGIESRALSEVNQDVIQGYMDDAVIALAEQIDISLHSVYTLVPGGQVIVNAGNITEANILSARKILVDNKVPVPEMKFGVVATSQTNALLQIDRLVRYDALGVANDISNAMVGNGVRVMPSGIGRLHSFELAESQLVAVAGSPSAAHNLFYSRDAILFASRPLENPEDTAGPGVGVQSAVVTDPISGIALRLIRSYQHLMGAHVITIDVLYGYTLQRPEHIVDVQTAA